MPARAQPNRRRNRAKNKRNPNINRVRDFDDEQTRIALALSISESMVNNNNYHGTTEQVELPAENKHSGHEVNAFSILMTPKPEAKKRGKKSKAGTEVAAILRVTEDQRLDNLTKRISLLLSRSSFEDKAVSALPDFVDSRLPERVTSGADKENRLWFADCDDAKPGICEQFYVKKLIPFVEICTVKPGSKIKRMGHIPGWKPLTNSKVTFSRQESDTRSSGNVSTHHSLHNATQTAYLLAELADDVKDTTLDCSHRLDTNTLDITHGFLSPQQSEAESKQSQAYEQLANDLSSVIGDSTGSDLNILCRDDVCIPAHSIFLKARCPTLLNTSSKGKIDLTLYSRKAVEALLGYIYCGNINIESEIAQEVNKLANRFQILVLKDACETIIPPSQDPVDEINHYAILDKTLQNLLHEVWSSESESDSETCEMEECTEPEGARQEQDNLEVMDIDELYQQALSSSQTKECDSDSDSSDDSFVFPSVKDDTIYKPTVGAALLCKLEQSFMFDDMELQ